MLAVFTGSAWTADLANTGLAPSTTVQWVAAMAAFLSALIIAVAAAANWKQEVEDHTADKLLWSAVDEDVDGLNFGDGRAIEHKALEKH